jgi:hypothetical protein
MNRFFIFIMRAVLAAFFAVVITRFFYGSVAPLYVAGLAIFLMGMSYVTEYYRRKKQKK